MSEWWNQRQEAGQVQAPRQETQQQQQGSVEDPNLLAFRNEIDNRVVAVAQNYTNQAAARNAQYEEASKKFMSDPALAPYYTMAKDYFADQDALTRQQTPVAELLDHTIRYVARQKANGIKPPKQAPQHQGFPPGYQSYDTPLVDYMGFGKFKPENEAEKMEANQRYILNRRIDLDRRKSRADDADLAVMIESRKQQYQNSMDFQQI